jgi:hypothetical protein
MIILPIKPFRGVGQKTPSSVLWVNFALISVRVRAQRKAGEFLGKLQKGHPGPGRGNKTNSQVATSFSPFRQAVEEAGIGKDDAWRYQQVAAVRMDRKTGLSRHQK